MRNVPLPVRGPADCGTRGDFSGIGASAAPDLGVARQVPTTELGVYWRDSAAHCASQRVTAQSRKYMRNW